MNPGERQADAITSLTGDAFASRVLQGRGPIAVEFMSYSCAHCGAIEPVLQQAAKTLKSKEEIFRVNIANERDLADSFEVQGTPTIILFLNGSEVGRLEGPSPEISSILAELTQPFEGLMT
jgi:thioredoxin 1